MNKNKLTAMEIFEESEKLELSTSYSIENYMVHEHGIDWNFKSILLQVAEALTATMELIVITHSNGCKSNCWRGK